MHLRLTLAPWLRRGVEAGFVGALLSGGTLVAFRYSRPDPRVALPHGLDGAMILVPALLALGVFAVSYPIFLAATRGDAILGGVAAFLVAADLLMAVSLLSGASIWVAAFSRNLPLGSAGVRSAVFSGATGLALAALGAFVS
jgi:hypothetical protein